MSILNSIDLETLVLLTLLSGGLLMVMGFNHPKDIICTAGLIILLISVFGVYYLNYTETEKVKYEFDKCLDCKTNTYEQIWNHIKFICNSHDPFKYIGFDAKMCENTLNDVWYIKCSDVYLHQSCMLISSD